MIPSPQGPSKLLWKLFAGYAVLMVVALTASAVLIIREVEQYSDEELTDHLRMQAALLGRQTRGMFDAASAARLDEIAKSFDVVEGEGPRVTFVAADGVVLGDSWADVALMDSHAGREEIREALDKGWGQSTRWSNTLKRNLKYVALRVGDSGNPEGFVRVALAVKTIGAKARTVRNMVWTIALVAMAASGLFALGLARLWTRPIRRVTRIAARLSRGDLEARARVRGSDELAWLAQSLNEMGEHLGKQLSLIDGQRRTLEALLNQLQEGVVVVGPNGRILLSNPAAAGLLHPDEAERPAPGAWAGRPVETCVPQLELQRLLLKTAVTLASAETPELVAVGATSEARIEIQHAGGDVVLLARASDITIPNRMLDEKSREHASGPFVGRILTLTDITEIARLIQIKTDFVANASHELRTPLSAIRAAIETLTNIEPGQDVESSKRFLGVIDRHSARLQAMVADLLALSRLESAAHQPKTAAIDVPRFCRELTERWAERLKEKEMRWECDVPPGDFEIEADGVLLGLVLDNLIDNAVKFTDRCGHVSVAFKTERDAVRIEVRDDGRGIPAPDRERVFERFYQVEQARTGGDASLSEKRGTGLGLAIVRHAVASMGGEVSLESEVGAGTRVVITVPQSR